MSGFAGQRLRPWMGDATGAEQAAGGDARDDAGGAAAKGLGDASTNASAISFGFAATAILISMFLLMAIFEHLIKPSLSSSSSSSSSSRTSAHGDEDGQGHGQSSHSAAAAAAVSPDKLFRPPDKMEVVQAEDLTVLMPGQRYPTFLAQPAPLLPWPREGVRWPPHGHGHRRCFVPP
ncbi:uncharacterized protein LOC102713081 [Oryza brachyantha]|uniref:uncharacterized protein LOC102713081 n=1 Tax=Oryza brachyantha TaxID=4533 RepID=UPI0003EA8B9D|nr:uncharacterized protein LOC102713081 [Oryza brachyantha]XP_015692901.1 uncharacterized protein LOC102713081 [Oryza brachyantha]XP_015692903.1 uncharacterized protein LOC102713081 [Oryza brachyantha]XP_040380235.1 uncharacterized protein LOC102713081 [Oryza brachyantha]